MFTGLAVEYRSHYHLLPGYLSLVWLSPATFSYFIKIYPFQSLNPQFWLTNQQSYSCWLSVQFLDHFYNVTFLLAWSISKRKLRCSEPIKILEFLDASKQVYFLTEVHLSLCDHKDSCTSKRLHIHSLSFQSMQLKLREWTCLKSINCTSTEQPKWVKCCMEPRNRSQLALRLLFPLLNAPNKPHQWDK